MLEALDKNAICFCTDDNYVKYLCVTIQSIIDNISIDHTYDIVILSHGVSQTKQKEVKAYEKSNVHIRFFEMEEMLDKDSDTDFFVSGHVSRAAYFRIYIPEIFHKYEKVVYLDCDTIVFDDIYDIFSFELHDKILGVVYDAESRKFEQYRVDYITNTLKINPLEYFCSGIIVYNIQKACEFKLKSRCIEVLNEIPQPMFHDQDVLNVAVLGKVCFLPMTWHVQWHVLVFNDISQPFYQENIFYQDYTSSLENIKILHYDSSAKPWNLPNLQLSRLWWKIARKTPYYEEFLYDIHEKNVVDLSELIHRTGLLSFISTIIKSKYKFYKILSKILFGKYKINNKVRKYRELSFTVDCILKKSHPHIYQ